MNYSRDFAIFFIIALTLFFFSFASAADKKSGGGEVRKQSPAQIEAQMKAHKNKYKYNDKIENYDLTSADNFLGKWSLILPDGDNHGDLIIKKMGDTFYAEVFGTNHWKGIGYLVKGKLLIAFKYTNEVDAGYVSFWLKDNKTLVSRSIDYDGTFRWQGDFTRDSSIEMHKD